VRKRPPDLRERPGTTFGHLMTPLPDDAWPGMWRIQWPDGRCSDMANLSRAKDAAAAIAEREPPPRNRRRFHWKLQWSKTPPEACPVRQPSLAGVRQRRAS
jgi:hypothetical protein